MVYKIRRNQFDKKWLNDYVFQNTTNLFEGDSILKKDEKKVIDYYERLETDRSVEKLAKLKSKPNRRRPDFNLESNL